MAVIDREIEQAVAAEQVRVLEAVRWAFAAYNGDLDKIAQHCFGMSFEWTRRLRDEELERVREGEREWCAQIAKRMDCELPPSDFMMDHLLPVSVWERAQCWYGDKIATAIKGGHR